MKKHKGYYIDNTSFSSKEEIDAHLKKMAVERFLTLNSIFCANPSMECSVMCAEQADKLNKEFGFTWEQIEELENSVMN